MHTWVSRFAIGLFFLALVSACDPAASRIVGKWKASGDPSGPVWEFSGDGAVKTASGPGKYSFGSSTRMKIQTQFATFIYDVEIEGDTMKWRDPNGAVTELKRVP